MEEKDARMQSAEMKANMFECLRLSKDSANFKDGQLKYVILESRYHGQVRVCVKLQQLNSVQG